MNFNWSFSRLKDFQTCPLRYQEVKLLGNYSEPEHPTTAWGTRGHLALEHRVRDGHPLPSEFAYLEPMVLTLKKLPGMMLCEQELAVDRQLRPVPFDSPDRWVRGIIDVLVLQDREAIAIDYKFGKVKPSAQLKLMACLVMAHVPFVEFVRTKFMWIAHRETTDIVYHRNNYDLLWAEFIRDAGQMEAADSLGVYAPKPSGLCRPSDKSGYKGCVVTSCSYCGRGNK